MLLVTPQAANKTIGQGGFQEVEQMALFKDMVCYQEEVRDPTRVAEVLNRVISKAFRGSAPAQINIPRDMWTQVVDIERAEKMSPYFLDAVFDAFKDVPAVTDVRGDGMMAAIDLAVDKAPGVRGYHAQRKTFENGVHIFDKSITPVKDINGLTILDHDEFMRPETTMQSLGSLDPSFAMMGEMAGFDATINQRYPEVESVNHVHTAGNSSGIVDTVRLSSSSNARKVIAMAFIPAFAISYYFADFRIAIASVAAYAIGQFLDVYVFSKVRERIGDNGLSLNSKWYLAPVVSTFFAQLIDTYLFYGIAFKNSADE